MQQLSPLLGHILHASHVLVVSDKSTKHIFQFQKPTRETLADGALSLSILDALADDGTGLATRLYLRFHFFLFRLSLQTLDQSALLVTVCLQMARYRLFILFFLD